MTNLLKSTWMLLLPVALVASAGAQNADEIIEKLYVRCLTREPTAEETQHLLATIEKSPNEQQGLEDVFWALLNSREFLFNH